MEKSQSQRHKHGGSSPYFLRTKSGSTAAISSPLPKPPITSKTEPRKIKKEAAATAEEAHSGRLVRFLPRSASKAAAEVPKPKRKRSASTSPSAWALSPGRSLPSSSPATAPPVVKSSAAAGSKKFIEREVKSGVSGVLKYFRQKRVSPLLEGEYHQFRLSYNRLLQLRFANARAEASMATVRRAAQGKLLNGWVRISMMRKLSVGNRCEIQKMKQGIKLYNILRSDMEMLNQWWRIEAKNVEAVGRVVRKLSAVSLCLPLVQNAQADVMSVYDALSSCTEVMENLGAVIMDMYYQVEKTCFLMTEVSVMLKQYKQLFQDLDKQIALVALPEAEEKILRVYYIQLMNEDKGTKTYEDRRLLQ